MALNDYLSKRGSDGGLTAEQVNQAFRDVYGIDAPPQVLYDFVGHIEGGPGFYERVAKGDFVPDIQKRDPGYFQRAKVEQLANQQLEMRKKAYEPMIASKEAEKGSLQARYDSIIADLSNREQKTTNTTTKNVSAEYAKRGIPLSSDAYNRELAGQVAQQNQDFGVEKGKFTAQLGTEQNAIDQAIAQMRAGNPDVAIPAGNDLFSPTASNELAQNTYQNISLPESKLKVEEGDLTKQYSDLVSLRKQLGSLS